ncbi:hypothetical protein QQ008_14155 [Fulvivirgaceae bacterium BMA10]|uniref:Nuclear transport factor 2 family protein n=1 Tax=Splendidivirga corallicola TaxID=3051826 RepID=A0ABT8KP90_9BACT|nr:hypothetical protein [Fulvivirgaceae bacterium BMA10]
MVNGVGSITRKYVPGLRIDRAFEQLEKKLTRYFKSLNSHHIGEILDFFSEDFQLHFSGYDDTIDKTALKSILAWDKGVNGKVSFQNLVINNELVTIDFTEQNDFFRLIGIKELKATITYAFDPAGKILKQTYTPFPDQPSFQEYMKPAVQWAKSNRQDELNEIYPNDQMIFNEEMAKRWLILLKQWKRASESS